jgi:hypothetical protein
MNHNQQTNNSNVRQRTQQATTMQGEGPQQGTTTQGKEP